MIFDAQFSNGVIPNAYNSIAIGSPWVVPSSDEISFPPLTNKRDDEVYQLYTKLANSGQIILMLCKKTFLFRLLKTFVASI